MRLNTRKQPRRGAVLPLVAICTVALMGMLALAIDIGMVAIARSQAQNAADSAAMAGARTINGSASYNISQVPINAVTAATDNVVFNTPVQGNPGSISNPSPDVYTSGQVTVQCGGFSYVYNDANPAAEGFKLTMPGKPAGEPYSAVSVTVQTASPTSFGRVFGLNSFNVAATSAAVHRPRDVVIIMDLSGSMRFESLPGTFVDGSNTAWPSYGNYGRNTSMNPNPIFPQFGHYSAVASAALQGSTSFSTSTGVTVDPMNIEVATNGGAAIVNDIMTSGSTGAFSAAPASQATAPGGDDFPKYKGAYVPTVNQFLNNTASQATMLAFCRTATGPSATGYTGNGYTEGPGYWGKTFFMWPPDPRGTDLDANNTANHANNGAKDWRQRFFFKVDKAGKLYWLDHNTILFDPNGSPMTGTNTVTPILKTPQTQTTVTENGVSVTYTYAINYAAIFSWLKANPQEFPAQMTSGRIQYYTAIPDPTDKTLNNRFWTQSPLTDLNERFWKDYVDFVLGQFGTGAGTYDNTNSNGGGSNVPLTACIGNGDFFQWGATAIQIKQKPDNDYKGQVNNGVGYPAGTKTMSADFFVNDKTNNPTTPVKNDFVRFNYGSTIYQITNVVTVSGVSTITLDQGLTVAVANDDLIRCWSAASNFPYFMDYNDNVYRPRHQFWFGPLTFLDWLGNYTTNHFWWPGNVHEAQAWACKAGIQTSIGDIKNNHPNDYVGMAFFSTPMYSSGDTYGRHNAAVVPLGQNYQQLIDSLWFPPATVTGGVSTVTPYDADFQNVPRAAGGTCPGMTFMMGYNMLSGSVSKLRTYATPEPNYRGNAGGLGRKGADRLVIFETDGNPNTRAVATLSNNGADSYYPIRILTPANLSNASNEFPTGGGYSSAEVYSVVQQITALDTASPPGYSTSRKKALVYSIGYGTLFDPGFASANQTTALTFLQTIQYYGNTSSDMTGANFPTSQRIYGTPTQRINSMQSAFTNIMQAGVQVSIIQ